MNISKALKVIAGLMMVTAAVAYSQTAYQQQAGIVFLVTGSIFLLGYFAGEDI